MWEAPRRRKRVVMITPDIMIDRRILIEAETLIEDGYEVYLLAGWDATHAELFEVIGRVRTERIQYHGIDQRLCLVHKMHRKAIEFLNRVAAIINRIGEGISRRESALINRFRTKTKSEAEPPVPGTHESTDRWTLFHNIFRGIVVLPWKLSVLAIHLTARLLNLGLRGISIGFPLVTRFNGYEHAYFKRAAFYRPDIIHVHDLPMLRIGARLKRRLGVPLIYDMHEFYPEQETLSTQQRLRLRYTEKQLIPHCDRLITVNPLLAQEISRSYGNVTINVIQNATIVPNNFYYSKYDLFRDEYDIGKSDIIILYQGWISEHRNIHNLVAGLSGVTIPIKLVIMGYGDYKEELARIAKEKKVSDKIVFVPSKSQEELLYYTASADLGIIPYPFKLDPNTKYSSPNKMYEFIAARLPILCNRLPFVMSVVVDNQFGLAFDLDSPESFTFALNNFPYDRLDVFRENLILNGSKYLWAAEAPKLLDLYRFLGAA